MSSNDDSLSDLAPHIAINVVARVGAFGIWLTCARFISKHRAEDHFSSNHDKLLIAFMIITAVHEFVILPIASALLFTNAENALQFLISGIDVHTSALALELLVTRGTLIYWQQLKLSRCAEWKQHIDPRYSKDFERLYQTFGRPVIIYTIAASFWIIQVVCWFVIYFAETNNNVESTQPQFLPPMQLASTVAVSVPWLLRSIINVVILYNSGIQFHSRHMFKELLISLYGTVCMLILLFSSLLLNVHTSLTSTTHHTIATIIAAVSFSGLWYLTTIWSYTQSNNMSNGLNRDDKTIDVTKTYGNDLLKALSEENGYNYVMERLQRQYAVEGLIFLTIMIQWQNVLVKYKLFGGIFTQDMLIGGRKKPTLASIVPQSAIINKFEKQARTIPKKPAMKAKVIPKYSFSIKPYSPFSARKNQTESDDIVNATDINIIEMGVISESPSSANTENDVDNNLKSDSSNDNCVANKSSGGKCEYSSNVFGRAPLQEQFSKIFEVTFVDIYLTFLAPSLAPMEINISTTLKHKHKRWFRSHHQGTLKDADIVSIWTHLVEACDQIQTNIRNSLSLDYC